MTDAPPLPTIPTGQSRTFDLTFPELPAFPGPGSGPNPSGGGGPSGCQDDLLDLIAAEDWAGLIDFLEIQTGQPIEVLAAPEWNQVKSDGITREKVIEVCATSVTLTITGTLATTFGCEALLEQSMPFAVSSFLTPPKIDGANPSPPGADYNTTDWLIDGGGTFSVPKMVWLQNTLGTEDEHLIERWIRDPTYNGGSVTVDGVEWVPALRVNCSYTATFTKRTTHDWQALTSSYIDTPRINYYPPLVGFKAVQRGAPGVGAGPLYTDDPLREGEIVDTGGFNDAITNSDYNNSVLSTSPYERWLPRRLDDNSMEYLSLEAETIEEIEAQVAEWNSTRSVYDPVWTMDTTVDPPTMRVDHLTKQNAIYLPSLGCPTDVTEEGAYQLITAEWGGYVHDMAGLDPTPRKNLGDAFASSLMMRYVRDHDHVTVNVTNTPWINVEGAPEGSYIPHLTADADAGDTGGLPTDGTPPDTQTNPPITPVGGGCRSRLFGPSSCNWNVPVPASPQPASPDFDTPNFPMPKDTFPDVPVVDTHLPNIPELPCIVPDFGNIDPCGKGNHSPAGGARTPAGRGAGGGPGYMGPLPGGRDRMGHRGSAGTIAGVKTQGQTYAAPDYLFDVITCPGQITPGIGCMAVITQLLMDCGINPIDIIFQVGPEWDKPFPADRCFPVGSRIFDAASWTAQFLMLTIVDEGEPSNDVYIGPPWHRPGQTTWIFDEHYDLFNVTRNFSSEEPYGWVEVFGPNVTSPIISRVDDPFSTEDSPTLRVEVGWNFSQSDAEDLAAYKASLQLREPVSIQATVPYSSDYFLRDLMLLAAPDRGFEESYVITGKESDISPAGWFHILTGMLPATLAELDRFPEVTDEYSAIEGGFA